MSNTPPRQRPGPSSSTDQTKRSPRDYAAAVHRHSLRSKEHYLFTGTNYRSLALFLKNANTLSATTPIATYSRDHDILIIHDLTPSGHRITRFNSITGLQGFNSHPLPGDGCGQLLFLRGLPSSEWVNTIGARYRVDPELFRRHLPMTSGQETFDLPAVASSSSNIVKLTITSIGHRAIADPRQLGDGKAAGEHFNLPGNSLGLVGQSMIRKFSVHDEQHFSVEQDVYISVMKRGDGWLGGNVLQLTYLTDLRQL